MLRVPGWVCAGSRLTTKVSLVLALLLSCCLSSHSLGQQRTEPAAVGRAQNGPAAGPTAPGAADVDSVAGATPFAAAPSPPLSRIVLYNSGVGHMQHAGTVEGNAKIEIKFSGHDVDDALKSLVFEDAGGGTIRSVEYQPAPDAEAIAASAAGQPLTVSQLLQKYRGETVKLHATDNLIEGVVFGVELRQVKQEAIETVIVMTADGMRSIDIPKVERFEFTNPSIRDELQLAMAGVAKSRHASQKRLELLCAGTGKRDIKFAYVVDAPIWRMSYRLAMTGDNLLLHGWAHVNNATGVPWKNVAIELRTGQPRTFHAELFAPVVTERPNLGLSVFGLPRGLTLVSQWFGQQPPQRFGDEQNTGTNWPGGGIGGGIGGGAAGGMGGFGGGYGYGGGVRNDVGTGAAKDENSNLEFAERGVDPSAAFRTLAGEDSVAQMVRFTLKDKVDLESGKSSALPVFSATLNGRRVTLVQNVNQAGTFAPVRAVQFKNSTGNPLIAGPISINQNGDFVGDAQLERLAVNQQFSLIYAADRAISVTREDVEPKTRWASVVIDNDLISATARTERKFKLQFDNKDTEPRLLVVSLDLPEEATDAGATITPTPQEIKDNIGTFEFPIAATASETSVIVITSDESSDETFESVDLNLIRQWLKSDAVLSDIDRTRLQALTEYRRQVMETDKRIVGLNEKRLAVSTEQERLRENLRVLTPDSKGAAPFLTKLNQAEDRILKIDAQLEEARQTLQQLQNSIHGIATSPPTPNAPQR